MLSNRKYCTLLYFTVLYCTFEFLYYVLDPCLTLFDPPTFRFSCIGK